MSLTADAPDRTVPAVRASLHPHPQLRLGGLPVAAIDGLGDERHRDAVARHRRALARLVSGRERLSEALHGVIGGLDAADGDRRRLVRFRRALYALDRAAASAALASVGRSTRAAVDDALGDAAGELAIWLTFEPELDAAFAGLLDAERRRLLAACDESFRLGLAIASPELIAGLDRYGARIDAVDRRGKRVERSVLSYLLRAAAKTTPFSSLGPVAFPRAGAPAAGSTGSIRRSRWSIHPVARVLNALAEDPDAIAGLEVRRSPHLRAQPDGSIRTDRTTWVFKDLATRDDYANCTESEVEIGVGLVPALVASVIGDAPMRFDELVAGIDRHTGLGAARAERLALSFIRLGVVVVPALAVDALGGADGTEVIAPLAASSVRGAELAERMRAYLADAERVARAATGHERVAAITAVRERVRELYDTAGLDAGLPRSVVYEDVVRGAVGVDAPAPSLDGDGLVRLVRFVDLLDESHVRRALLAGYLERAGGTAPVVPLVRGFSSELLDSFLAYDTTGIPDDALADDPWLRWGGAWRWEAARRRLVDVLRAQTARMPLSGADVAAGFAGQGAEVGGAAVFETAPRMHGAFRAANLLVQAGGAGEPAVVLNDCFGGVGFHVSRFAHALDGAAASFTAGLERTAEAHGVVLAELGGGAAFTNLNLHGRLLSRSIVVPGDPPTGAAGAIDPAGLEARLSEGRAVLVDRASGMTVHPEYAGYLVPAATPKTHQVLSLFTPSATLSRKPAELHPERPEPGELVVRPRMLMAGVVVSRAAVLLAAADLPSADPLTAAGYAEWLRFWARHGIPERVYLRLLGEGRRQKPFFFDVTLIVAVSNLHSRLRAAEPGTSLEIVEALPHPDTATILVDGAAHVAESMVTAVLTEEETA
ncbi:lantibiotic dehydratase [Agromyces archimandritae]|uniref:Lantibiotic dehydratase n=1 Tax=Agromyces archimandritae TaxID=2781962 RepID=A0A975IN00_9MICO|nr:lantibiotic dehydratase [Agromyces archimandritae]QTX04073.1 lantibiotic dehydratase [Agromyces archimandritae]